ncbi:YwmB family TATA-box binding protein [Paenibacillus sinopodophylli]|uniref:YwmB family TATA-box binding protein n=1 Tax=Paenibacillus sinopodophylli TaxID=1837342 RepID=UPI001486D9BC|nr:YwmB family TATA-box binding protein [Paenibacillus sinopodophylli]
MYIPNQNVPVRHRMSAKERAKRTKRGVLLALLVITACAIWAIWQADRAPGETTPSEQLLQHDLKALWEWSDDQLKSGSSGAAWSIRWNVTGKVGTMRELVDKLFIEEQGEVVNKVVRNEGKTVSGTVNKYGGNIAVHIVQNGNQSEQLMILLETTPNASLQRNSLLQQSADISSQIALISPAFTSSMKVQGYAKHEHTLLRLSRLTDAKAVDRYEDTGTISETLYTPMLHSVIAVENGKSANLQVALHKDTDTDNTELTIGIPVITGEYSVSTVEND